MEDSRQLHHDRGTGPVIIGGLAPADAVHVRADDVHLVRASRAHLGAVDLLPWTVCRGLCVECAKTCVRLAERIVVHPGTCASAAEASTPADELRRRPRSLRSGRIRTRLLGTTGGRAVLVLQTFGIGATV